MSLHRIIALVGKEWRQTMREPSYVAICVFLPIILLLIFGYGLSLDMKCIRLGIVSPVKCKVAEDVVKRFCSNSFFKVTVLPTEMPAREMMSARTADAVIVLPQQLDRAGFQQGVDVNILLNSTMPVIAGVYREALQRSLLTSMQSERPHLSIRSRVWFNESVRSTWFLVPGVIVIVMSIIGCMLTALQMAKEYEQGTLEQLFSTPATVGDLLVAKLICNYAIGMVAFLLCIFFSRYVFDVPMIGSFGWIWLGASLYLFTQMTVGLLISSVAKSQFVSAVLSVILSFLPVVVLSGFFFDIPGMAPVMQKITAVFPARHFAEFVLTSFLVGDVPRVYLQDYLALVGSFVVLLTAACLSNKRNAGRVG